MTGMCFCSRYETPASLVSGVMLPTNAITCLFSTMSWIRERLRAGSAPSSAVKTSTGWPAIPPWAFTHCAHTLSAVGAAEVEEPAGPE